MYTITAGIHLQLPINIHPLSHPDLQTPHPLTRLYAPFFILNRRLKLVAPRAAPAITIAVVIAQQILPTRLLAAPYLERLVHRGEEIFGQVGCERTQAGKIGRGGGRRKTAEKVSARGRGISQWEICGEGGMYNALSNWVSVDMVGVWARCCQCGCALPRAHVAGESALIFDFRAGFSGRWCEGPVR